MFKKLFSRKPTSENTRNKTDNASLNDTQSLNEYIDGKDVKSIILKHLTQYQSSVFPQGVIEICSVLSFEQSPKGVELVLKAPFPCRHELSTIANQLTEQLAIDVVITAELEVLPVRQHAINNVANIIAIASGKGGVGKSTTAVNLAYALIAEGAKVGILDADIYGPSIPAMLGIKNEKPSSTDGKLMTALNAHGLSAMSIGFLVPDEDATVWRGPMASGAFNQLLTETAWPALDYLLIDMPPGTGDIQLTLAQKVPVAAAVVITTPQDIALADAVKGIAMFDKVQVPVLGIVENMSYHQCENCGHHSYLFGQDGGKDIAEDYQTQLLGQLPLDISIREDADLGKSVLIENSTSDIALLYRKIANNVAAELFLQLDNRSSNNAEICQLND
jgi:ATP-binding protein involved in chromosome partitioning